MSNPVAEAAPPRPRSWRGLLLALALFLLVPLIPGLDMVRLLLPVEQTGLLLVPVIAVCALTGWIGGGRWWLAGACLALAIWILLLPAGSAALPYDKMARGWALILAGSFGLMTVWNPASAFITRSLGAIGLATGAGLLLAVFAAGGIGRIQQTANSEFARRGNQTVETFLKTVTKQDAQRFSAWTTGMGGAPTTIEEEVTGLTSISERWFPALLALESLAALSLGWAVYQRLSNEPTVPPLSRLADFRFNDLLVWGVAVGGTLLLPAFHDARNVGVNLLVFFGGLYFLRGLGVLSWMTKRWNPLLKVLGVLSLVFLWMVPLAIGVSDTWLDWRHRLAAR